VVVLDESLSNPTTVLFTGGLALGGDSRGLSGPSKELLEFCVAEVKVRLGAVEDISGMNDGWVDSSNGSNLLFLPFSIYVWYLFGV